MNLYEVNEQIKEYFNSVDEETGEVTSDLDITALFEKKEELTENLVRYIRNTEADITAYKAEIKRLSASVKALENRKDRSKEFLSVCLNGEKYKCAAGSVYYRSTESGTVSDEEKFCEYFAEHPDLNKGYITFKPAISTTAIKDALKEGVEIPFASLTTKTTLIIK